MAKEKAQQEEPEERSRAAGACLLFVLAGAAVAVVFAISTAAGVLSLWAVGVLLLWRAANRRVSDSSATPPPRSGRPSCADCAGHSLVSVTPSGTEKGMLIYASAPPDRPNHTHIHIA